MSNQPSQPTPEELAVIDAVLDELRRHFHEWPEWHDDPHGLIGFAWYEGCGDRDCCRELLGRAVPFALGHRLVERHGFAWTMIGEAPPRRFAVSHPLHDAPIALDTLESGEWFDPEDVDDSDPPTPGWRTHHSYGRIVERTGQQARD